MVSTRSGHLARQLSWLVAVSAAVVLAAAPAALLAGVLPAADTRAPFLSTFFGAWTLIAGGAAVTLARALFNVPTGRAWIIVAGGALAAAAAGAGLVIWTEARFGYFDPEFVGGTWLLPFLVGLMAVAFASAALVSGMARLVAAGVAGLCLAWLTIAGWSNVAGAGRSIGEVSWGLVGAFAVVGAFVAMALLTLATKRRWT